MEDKTFKNSSLSEKVGMVKNFASAITSRGLKNKKIDKANKQLRVLSCFGDDGELIPCEYLRDSKTEGKHYCGGCGCGDKPGTWLTANGGKYSKLDYPKLHCPLQMPGFANYEESTPDESVDPITRRYYIENVDLSRVSKIDVSSPEPPEPKEKKNEN
tara:strand:- start:207 stop:680 length:474 start_codon:yes stop_codon:yes gene_type:complete